MAVEVRQPDPSDRIAIKNLTTFYRYELLPFIDDEPRAMLNRSGVIGDADVATHEQAVIEQDVWWTKPGILLPMLLCVDGEVAGFALVARPPHADRSVDFRMEDFFVTNRHRRAGVGRAAVAEIFHRHPGRWEIGWLARNLAAQAFWRAVTRPWQPEEWIVPQSPGTLGLPGLRVNVISA